MDFGKTCNSRRVGLFRVCRYEKQFFFEVEEMNFGMCNYNLVIYASYQFYVIIWVNDECVWNFAKYHKSFSMKKPFMKLWDFYELLYLSPSLSTYLSISLSKNEQNSVYIKYCERKCVLNLLSGSLIGEKFRDWIAYLLLWLFTLC